MRIGVGGKLTPYAYGKSHVRHDGKIAGLPQVRLAPRQSSSSPCPSKRTASRLCRSPRNCIRGMLRNLDIGLSRGMWGWLAKYRGDQAVDACKEICLRDERYPIL